ncbi:MAG: hypothetical protein JWO91_233 [Acidobacteriaceae bacterium]|nr:hypothetical protein [Acidobacteriaceae bacterium]
MRRLLYGALFLSLGAIAQTNRQPALTSGEIQSTEVTGQLMEENAYFRVSRVDLAPGNEFKVQQHKRDAVIVVLARDGILINTQRTGSPEKLGEGDVRFLRMGTDPTLTNSSDRPARFVVIELKQHSDAEIRSCAEPMKCIRPIRVGGAEIGETTSLFTNGFITGYRYRLSSGGTLTSSYFSSELHDHLVLIALTGMRANFEGTEEQLKTGEAYPSDATEVEVDAGPSEARWVVIRVLTNSAGSLAR